MNAKITESSNQSKGILAMAKLPNLPGFLEKWLTMHGGSMV